MLIRTSSTKISTLAESIAKYFALLASALIFHGATTAATLTSPESPLSHTFSPLELKLNNKNDGCQLQVANKAADETQSIPLLLKSPCYWISSSETKSLLHYSYESVAADKTLLVAGTPLDWSAKKRTYQKLPDNAYCTQFLQGVVISKKQVFAVDEKMVAAHCETGLAIDEKIFYAMAHNPKRYQEKSLLPDDAAISAAEEPTNKTEKAPSELIPSNTVETVEKSFLDSVTDTVKGFFSGQSKDAK